MQGSKGNKQLEHDIPGIERGSEKLAAPASKPLVGGAIGRVALMAALALVLIAGVSVGAVAIIKNTNFGNSPILRTPPLPVIPRWLRTRMAWSISSMRRAARGIAMLSAYP